MNNIEAIWTEKQQSIFAFILSKVHDRALAEDLLQDVFIKLHTKFHTLHDQQKVHSWLYQIARNAITDHFRSQKKPVEFSENLAPASSEHEKEQALQQELATCIQHLLPNLPEKYRKPVELYHFSELSQQEIAAKEELSLAGAKSRIQRGRTLLKNMFTDCCSIQQDVENRIIDCTPKNPSCKYCDTSDSNVS